MNREMLSVLENIEREKGVDKEILFLAIESALASAAKKILKDDDESEDVRAEMDRETGEIRVFHKNQEIESTQFGRIAAQTAKQVILQKIREAEKEVIFNDYKDRAGILVSGTVHRFEKGNIVVDLGKAEGIIPRSEQSRNEHYKQGDPIKVYITEVNMTPKGPEIILSRAHPGVVKKMFEQEVPEISDNIVEIKVAAREAGERTKIAVYSKDDKVDPVGACVGMRGTRVKNIVRDLYGEKIDIVRWNSDLREFLKAAMAPAEIQEIIIDEDNKSIALKIADDQLSLAIGKHGQNVRLASQLVGYALDINPGQEEENLKKEDAKAEEGSEDADDIQSQQSEGKALPEANSALESLKGISAKIKAALIASGYVDLDSLKGVPETDLLKIEGIGKVTAKKIVDAISG